MLKKIVIMLMAAALSVPALAGCSDSSPDSGDTVSPTSGVENTVTEVTLSENWSFDIGFGPNASEAGNYGIMYYARNFYDTLVTYDNGEIHPGLAETWNVSDDGLVYTFNLRKNVKFTDGTPFDAEAVKKNLEMIPLNLGTYNGFYGLVTTLFDEIVVVDPYTVEVHLIHPYYGALNDFSMEKPLAMVSPNAYNEDGSYKEDLNNTTLGTGPYMYQGETDGSTYTFVRNPDYWGEKPDVDVFYIKVIPDNDARQLALRNGELDILAGSRQMSYDSFGELKNAGYGALVSDEISNTQYLAFNMEKEPFDDLKIRQAISYAIDKATICENVLQGMAAEADSLFEPNLPYCNVEITPYTYDKQKAIEMLEEAGWVDQDGDGIREKDGIKLDGELLYSTHVPVMEDIALVLSAQFKEVGIEMKLNKMEVAASYAEQKQGNYSIAHIFTYGGVWDPHTTVTNAKPGPEQTYPLPRAFRLIENADKLIGELNVTPDKNKVQETYDFILREINDKALVLPLYYSKELVVYNSDKISDYTFEEAPGYVHVPSIKLK